MAETPQEAETPPQAGAASAAAPPLSLTASRHFAAWLDEIGGALLLTTYQAGKLFLIGLKPDGGLGIFERTLERSMALHVERDGFLVSSLWQVWRFADVLRGQTHPSYAGHDRLYAPRRSWVTGDVDAHGLARTADGQLVFVNTLFSCLAELSDEASFRPIWRPPFVSRLVPEDRCHFNGFCLDPAGRPAYATCVAATDIADGWRDHRRGGGVVVDMTRTDRDGAIVARGLSMPHSPCLRADTLWVTNSGTGEVGTVDRRTGAFEPVCGLPGFGRGFALCGAGDRYAVITTSLPRDNRTFDGLALDDRLAAAGTQPRCGLTVIDLESGAAPHWLRMEGAVSELFDIAVLPGVRRPAAIGFRGDDIRRVIDLGPPRTT